MNFLEAVDVGNGNLVQFPLCILFSRDCSSLLFPRDFDKVGKLAQAFKTAVEARGFEREVEDANLVAAVSLGRSPPLSTNGGGKSENGQPSHLGQRMLSVLRGEEDEEERRRHQRAQGGFEKDEGAVISAREQKPFDWSADKHSPHGTLRRSKGGAGGNGVLQTNSSRPNSPRRTEGLARGELSGRQATKGRSYTRGVYHGSTLQSNPTQQYNEVAGTRRNCPNQQQQRDLLRYDSGAVARIEAAVFDTVRPSLLHPRPGSASVEGRADRAGCERITPSETSPERLRPRPQSARLAEPSDGFAEDRKMCAAYGRAMANMQGIRGDGQRACQGPVTPEAKMAAVSRQQQQQQQPVRPTTTNTNTTGTASATARRPASAGGRVVDTRVWCSNKNVTGPGSGVFRCRPDNVIRVATVRFENNGMTGPPSSPPVPTRAGEVPEFLRRKERDLIEDNREKWAAVNGRFAVVYDDNEQKRVSGPERVEYYRSVGNPGDGSNGGQRQGVRTMESGGWGVGRGGRALSFLRLEDSTMDGEGLLPDAGEQAFFDAWKPTGYDIDLSRYD